MGVDCLEKIIIKRVTVLLAEELTPNAKIKKFNKFSASTPKTSPLVLKTSVSKPKKEAPRIRKKVRIGSKRASFAYQ